MVRVQLGREPMGNWSVQKYCSSGHPQVLKVHPLVARKGKVTPFPTLFWLTCTHYRQSISRLEAEGYIAKVNEILGNDTTMAAKFVENQEEYRNLRFDELDQEDQKFLEERPQMQLKLRMGIGGSHNKSRIRCLHENFAHFLATGNNVVGEYIWNLGVIPECKNCSNCSNARDKSLT